MKRYFLAISLIATVNAFAQDIKISKGIKQAMDRIDTSTILTHIAFLADDKLKGRYPGTEGFQTATDYVIDQYKKIGLQPAGNNNAFTQKLIIRKSLVNNNSSVAILKDKNGNTDSLGFAMDFAPLPHPLNENVNTEGQLVFAGYGVEISGGYSDYNGIDVKGKIVVVINGAPPGLMSTLTAHFSGVGNKTTTAFTKGAKGVIIINPLSRGGTNLSPTIQSNTALNPEKTVAYGRGFVGDLKAVLNGTSPLLTQARIWTRF